MNKIQKPSFKKVHKHLQNNHSHGELYGELDEVPAVFSHSTSFEFDEEVKKYDLQVLLVDWVEDIKQWVMQNEYFIGHIKVFAESEKKLNLWISTTGKNINIQSSAEDQASNIKSVNINMTMIIFRADKQALKSVALENLEKKLPKHRKK